jgi:hypothetical protein
VLDSTANNATGTAGGSHTELDSAASAPGTSGAESSSDATQDDIPVLPVHEQRSDRFQWKPALAQYGLEISIQHAWRFVHENGTVDAVAYGPWFHDWIDSIGETRGWDDSDGWLDARDAAGNLWCQPRNAQATRA